LGNRQKVDIRELALLRNTLSKFTSSDLHTEYFQEIANRYNNAYREYAITEKRTVKDIERMYRIIQDGLNQLGEIEMKICRDILKQLDQIAE
jgi:hypothetical protein